MIVLASRVVMFCALFSLGLGFSGCSRTDERSYTVAAGDETGINYLLTTSYFADGFIRYRLQVRPNDLGSFTGQLNQKWHEEARRRLAVYETLQEYCAATDMPSVCDHLQVVAEEVETATFELRHTISLYSRKGESLGEVVCQTPYSYHDQSIFSEGGIEVTAQQPMSRKLFDDIHHVQVNSDL